MIIKMIKLYKWKHLSNPLSNLFIFLILMAHFHLSCAMSEQRWNDDKQPELERRSSQQIDEDLLDET